MNVPQSAQLSPRNFVRLSATTTIGGRMSASTGREISWNWLLNGSKLDIFPQPCAPGPGLFTPGPIPGRDELV